MSRTSYRTSARVTINGSIWASEQRMSLVTHTNDIFQVTDDGYLQHLDGDLQTTVFALPYIRESTRGVWDGLWIVVYRDLQ